MRIHLCVLTTLIFLSGCGGAEKAQYALSRGQQSLRSIHRGLSIKAWGINRALITENRAKRMAEAKLTLLKNGQFTFAEVESALDSLHKELGTDERYTSENFAYIMMTQIASERAHESLGAVDGYLESKKPIWKHLMKSGKETGKDFINELQSWGPLFKDVKKIAPDFNR